MNNGAAVYVNHSTAIGAIGTIMQTYDASELLDKLGIKVNSIASAESKDSSYGTRPLTDEEREYYQNLVSQINAQFDFVGGTPGENVWVVPQTEQAGVPWVGWNTQSPSLVDAVDRGVTLEFLGHSGPGEFSLFLQNGGFEAPQVLWSTAKQQQEGFWVDLNTHTHANWTFTEPGVHQVGVRFSGKTKDGSDFSTDGVLTFAVGNDTDVAEAQNTEWDPAAVNEKADSGLAWWIWALVGLGALVLVGSVAMLVASSRRKADNGNL